MFARLYKSPENAVKGSALHSSPHEWLRSDFDQPSPQFSSARRSLVMKLDQVTKCKSVFGIRALQSCTTLVLTYVCSHSIDVFVIFRVSTVTLHTLGKGTL